MERNNFAIQKMAIPVSPIGQSLEKLCVLQIHKTTHSIRDGVPIENVDTRKHPQTDFAAQ